MGITINRDVQFDQFVQFAQQSMSAGNTKAVARAEDAGNGLAARTITASTTDKAFALIRSRVDKTANDDARALFRQSVINMFGSEDKIPESVRKAMLLKDYGAGKPLTARRIIAVKQAIEQALNPIQKMTSSVAKAAVKDAAQHAQLSDDQHAQLSDEQIKMATGLVAKYGKGLSETGVRLLANFTAKAVTLSEFTCAKPDETAAKVETAVKKFVKDMSKWRNCVVGDSRLTAVDQKMANIAQKKLVEQLGKSERFYPEGHSRTFREGEIVHANYVINGQVLPKDHNEVCMALDNAVTRVEDRRAITSFLCQTQTTGGALIELMQEMGLPTTPTEFSKSGAQPIKGKPVKGMELLVSSNPADKVYKMSKTHAKETTFTLNVTGDGSRATVLVETKGDIVIALNAAKERAKEPIGTFTWQQEFVFDLTGDQPRIVAAHIGQQLEA